MKGKAPTVLTLTQHDIDGGRRGAFAAFTRHGYVFVQVYVRGRGRSGGVKSDNLGFQSGTTVTTSWNGSRRSLGATGES